MKSFKVIALFVSIFITVVTFGQTGLNFQGVARNESGVILASQTLNLKLSILQTTADGAVEYAEIRKTTTNAQGLFSVVIGDGKATSSLGNFNTIDWKLAPKFLKIEMDMSGGENFTTIGTTQLQSAAYAKFAESADATNLTGVVPVSKGGTGKNNLDDFKIALKLNEKADLASPAFTGTVTGITKSMVGLGNVDNTTDLSKPISTSTQTALDLKASLTQLTAKEDILNKSTNIVTDAASDNKYPSVKSVKTYVDNAVLSGVPDATDAVKGKILLAGALTGTADQPAIASNAIGTSQLSDVSVTDAKIATVGGSKITGDISGNANNISGVAAVNNGGTGANNTNDARANLGLTIGVNVESPLTVTGPITRVNNAIGLPVASSGVNGYLSSTDWTNFNSKINASEKAANNGVASLGADGKIPSIQIPAISFQSANVVASQSAMLALSNAVEGSIAIRTDNNKNYVLSTTPASTLSNWIELATPSAVTSVNGFAGPNVSLTTDHVAEGSTNKYYTNTQARNAISVTAPLTYDASAGTISMTTANANQSGYLNYVDWITFNSKMGTASATATFVPYTGATGPVNLGAYDLTLHGITVGKGKGSKFGNTVFGRMALFPNTTGDNNSAFGSGALAFNSIGSFNAAFGANALATNTTGGNNAGFGASALNANTTGGNNTAIGAFSMNANTVGDNNLAFGAYAMVSNISGRYNVATGSNALYKNTIGSNNTAIGFALYNNTTGNWNTGIGASSLYNNTTGELNTAIGSSALFTNTTGTYNTAIGNRSDVSRGDLTNATAIGNGAIVSESYTMQLGDVNLRAIKSAAKLTTGTITYPNVDGINGQVLSTTGTGTLTWTTLTGVSSQTITTTSLLNPFDFVGVTGYNGSAIDIRTAENLANGIGSLASNTDGIANVAVGIRTLNANTTGAANTAVGFESLNKNTTGYVNTAIGAYALRANTTGFANSALGSTALLSNTTGAGNVAVGEWSLLSNTTGSKNTGIGANALTKNTLGSFNTSNGYSALFNNLTGGNNTSIGSYSLVSNTSGSFNVAIGVDALASNISGLHNTAVGVGADVSFNNLMNATAIGSNSIVNASNTIQLGNGDITDVKTAGKLTTGAVTYPNAHGTSGQVLSTTGTGTLTWTTPGSNFVDLTADQTIAGIKTLSSGLLNVGLSNHGGTTSSIAFPHVDDPAFIGHNVVNNVGTMKFSAGDDATVDYFAFGYGVQNNFTEKLKIYADGQLIAPADATINGLTIGMGRSNVFGNTVLGNSALAAVTTGQQNTALGSQSLANNTTGFKNIAIGSSSLIANTIGNENIAIGIDALTSNLAGSGMVAIGNGALKYANNASPLYMTFNNAIGHNALAGSITPANNTGINNNAFGSYALSSNTSGGSNNAIGALSLFNNTTGNSNVALGSFALNKNTSGSYNIGMGDYALHNNTTGTYNNAIGISALYNNTTGNNNTVIGHNSGADIVTGNNNTIVGTNVTGLQDISNNIILANGTGAIKARHDGTNWSLTGNVAIGTASPTASAALEVSSTTKGFLPPKMTTTQRDAISSPAEGLTIYNTSKKGLEFYNGTAWVATAHYVGETYGGGTIFYIYDNGQHGLIASNSYQSTGAYWRAGTDVQTMALADGIGAGQKNTAIIIASQGYGNGDLYAARICNEYAVMGANGVPYGDWYLPSAMEMFLMKINAPFIPNFVAGNSHWTSTEYNSAGSAYYVADGGPIANDKNNSYYVRAIRSF